VDPGTTRNVRSHRDEPIRSRCTIFDGEIAGSNFRASWCCPRPRRLDCDCADLELAGEGIVTWRANSDDTGNGEQCREAKQTAFQDHGLEAYGP